MPIHRLSRFALVHFIMVEGKRYAVLFQTMTNALFFTPAEDYVAFLQEGTHEIDPPILQMLYDDGFIVDEGVDESDNLEMWLEQHTHYSGAIVARIIPSVVCNMKCTYCFRESC